MNSKKSYVHHFVILFIHNLSCQMSKDQFEKYETQKNQILETYTQTDSWSIFV